LEFLHGTREGTAQKKAITYDLLKPKHVEYRSTEMKEVELRYDIVIMLFKPANAGASDHIKCV
jgi:hypothetical protein